MLGGRFQEFSLVLFQQIFLIVGLVRIVKTF